jgi:crotonobetainyl-CoA:carnitine CoA-transferase CaiB-like acyl-CoA transferase
MGLPVRVAGEELPQPTRAPKVGEHTEEVLADVLDYAPDRIAALRATGALGEA